MKKGNSSLDIINGPLYKNIMIFSIPLMFSQMLQILFNSADTIIVGKFAGDSALAAVGATSSIVFLLTSLFSGLATGSNVLIARFVGLGNKQKISDAVHTSILIALLSGFFLTFAGFFSARFLLGLMDTPADILDQSTLYMRIYFAGILFLLLFDFGSAILRSKGDTKRPLYFLIISGIINVILNFFTVIILRWDVAGVATATVISEAVSAFLVVFILLKEEGEMKLDWKKLHLNKEITKDILRIGIPAGLSGVIFSLSNVFIQSAINSFNSTSVVAGNSAGANIEGYVYIGYTGIVQATITFTSQVMGAGRKDRLFPILKATVILVTGLTIVASALVCLGGPWILRLYTDEPSVVDIGMIRTNWVAKYLVLNGLMDAFVNSMRGMGVSTLPTLLMVLGICIVRMLWLGFVFPAMKTLDSIYMCYPVSWIITLIIEIVLWVIVYRRVMASWHFKDR